MASINRGRQGWPAHAQYILEQQDMWRKKKQHHKETDMKDITGHHVKRERRRVPRSGTDREKIVRRPPATAEPACLGKVGFPLPSISISPMRTTTPSRKMTAGDLQCPDRAPTIVKFGLGHGYQSLLLQIIDGDCLVRLSPRATSFTRLSAPRARPAAAPAPIANSIGSTPCQYPRSVSDRAL